MKPKNLKLIAKTEEDLRVVSAHLQDSIGNIRIASEVIEVTLDDQGEAWDTKNKPKHKS